MTGDGRNWLLTVAYDGTAYCGWQRQNNAPTVQATLETALARLFATPVAAYGASRTDSGVHALGQAVTIQPPDAPPIPADGACRALNGRLPADIRVVAISERPPGFHARYDAVGKAYTYLLTPAPCASAFLHRWAWPVREPLDRAAMTAAAERLVGTHDFTPFAVRGAEQADRNPVKTIHDVVLRECCGMTAITVRGNSFLYKMVRRMVGFLVAVGQGRLPVAAATELLAIGANAADGLPPALAYDTAPATGLFLERVFFSPAEYTIWRSDGLPFLRLT